MQGPNATGAMTEQPAHKGGFPPFDTKTFPSQIFWLAITFSVLFVVLWRVAGPLIAGTIATRRGRINDDIAEAQKARGDADAASIAYQTALAGARARAHVLAEDTRKHIAGEVEKAKAAADIEAHKAIAQAEEAIAQVEHAYDLDEKAKIADYKADAIEAENAEHNMTVLQAVRAYPMASFWAVVMSSTIVSCLSPFPLNLSSDEESQLTPSSDYGVLRCLPHEQFRGPTFVPDAIWCTTTRLHNQRICHRAQVAVCASSVWAARCAYRRLPRWPPSPTVAPRRDRSRSASTGASVDAPIRECSTPGPPRPASPEPDGRPRERTRFPGARPRQPTVSRPGWWRRSDPAVGASPPRIGPAPGVRRQPV